MFACLCKCYAYFRRLFVYLCISFVWLRPTPFCYYVLNVWALYLILIFELILWAHALHVMMWWFIFGWFSESTFVFFFVLVCNSLSHISVHFSKSPEFFFWLVSLHLVLSKDEIRRLATFPFWNFCLHCVGFTAKFNLIFKLKITCHG